jgi:D-alanyl-D-alanine carboxypeptidase
MSLRKTLAVMVVCIGQSSAQSSLDLAAIDSYLKPYARSRNFAGDVRIEKSGRVIFERAYGLADREKGIRNMPATRFHIASISMQFTAAAVLRLIDKGSISLSTQVSDLVSGITGGDKITIRDLLMERSGLPDINDLIDYGDVLKQHQTPASLVARIKGRPLLFEPGSKFLHEEHSAYNLLALIVEMKTGLPFAAAMKKLVFQPAGLSKSSIDEDAAPVAPDLAKGDQPDGVDGLKPAAVIHWSAKTGNASVVTTAREEAQWVRAVFGDDLLTEASRAAILDTSQKVGYGWFRSVSTRYHEAIYYMNGRAPGFAAFVLYLPQEQMSVVVFSNIYSSATTTIGYDLAAISLGLPYEPFQPSRSAPPAEQIKTSTGRFQFGPDFYQANAELDLIANGSALSLCWPSGDISPLIPLGRDRFMDRSYWEEVDIERDAAALPKTITYDHFRGNLIGRK